MEKEYDQLELFSQGSVGNQAKPYASKAFLSYLSRYEKVVLIIIGFIITGIASFSLGVEKGKNSVMLKTDSRLDIAVKPIPAEVSVPVSRQLTKTQQDLPVKKEEVKEYIQNYTIQVASFANKENAQKEADILKRKGLSALILSKGKFCIVCVGNFSKREEAETLLAKLKKQYQDCRIRRL